MGVARKSGLHLFEGAGKKPRERIEDLLGLGLSVRTIAKLLGYSNHISLNTYVKKRGIREAVAKQGG